MDLNRFRLFLIWPVLVLLAGSCSVFRPSTTPLNDMSYLYRPDQHSLFPRYLVFHEDAGGSTVFGHIRTGELLFSQANVHVQLQAELHIHYRLFEMGEPRRMVDSMSFYHYLLKEDTGEDYYLNFRIPAETGKRYMLEVITTDLVRNRAVQKFILVDKLNTFSGQNFFPVHAQTGRPYFRHYADSATVLRLISNDPSIDTIYLSYYSTGYPASRPPNLLLPPERVIYLPDTTYAVSLSPEFVLAFPRPGLYHFRKDTNRMEGFTMAYFGPGFPMMEYAEEMIGPLEYFALPTDYNRLITQPNRKLSVDNFWIRIAGNMEVARELIRVYYTRVYFSNYYFTSYKEGWKTERGMIYIIYGPPSILYKTDQTEEWIYGREGSRDAVRFVFRREDSPFTRNHFLLLRSEELVTFWSRAVEAWRSGRIFYID